MRRMLPRPRTCASNPSAHPPSPNGSSSWRFLPGRSFRTSPGPSRTGPYRRMRCPVPFRVPARRMPHHFRRRPIRLSTPVTSGPCGPSRRWASCACRVPGNSVCACRPNDGAAAHGRRRVRGRSRLRAAFRSPRSSRPPPRRPSFRAAPPRAHPPGMASSSSRRRICARPGTTMPPNGGAPCRTGRCASSGRTRSTATFPLVPSTHAGMRRSPSTPFSVPRRRGGRTTFSLVVPGWTHSDPTTPFSSRRASAFRFQTVCRACVPAPTWPRSATPCRRTSSSPVSTMRRTASPTRGIRTATASTSTRRNGPSATLPPTSPSGASPLSPLTMEAAFCRHPRS